MCSSRALDSFGLRSSEDAGHYVHASNSHPTGQHHSAQKRHDVQMGPSGKESHHRFRLLSARKPSCWVSVTYWALRSRRIDLLTRWKEVSDLTCYRHLSQIRHEGLQRFHDLIRERIRVCLKHAVSKRPLMSIGVCYDCLSLKLHRQNFEHHEANFGMTGGDCGKILTTGASKLQNIKTLHG